MKFAPTTLTENWSVWAVLSSAAQNQQLKTVLLKATGVG